MRSDFSFIDEIVECVATKMEGEGLQRTHARALIAKVLSTPTLALSADLSGASDIAQAVIIRRDESSGLPFEVLISLRVTVRKRHHPAGSTAAASPAVEDFSVTCSVVDMDGSGQIGELMFHYVELVRGVGPNRSKRTFPHIVLVLGDLLDLATEDAPTHWKEDFNLLAEAFDARVVFGKGTAIPNGVPRKLLRLFTLDPYAGKLPQDQDGRDIDFVPVDARTQNYRDVFRQVVAELKEIRPEAAFDPLAQRDLKPGEKVYHRKVGNSGGGYDNFNAGSNEACSHGKTYVRYYNSDQAPKGFARRYKNFDASWMHHCPEGSCGMYAVFCPEKASGGV